MWGGICEHGVRGRGSMASLEGLGAGSVMEHFLPCCWIHFSKVPLCTEPFVSTLFLLNKKGELYYCANESSRQRQILPRFLLISKSYGASEVPQKLTYSLRQLWGAAPLHVGGNKCPSLASPRELPVCLTLPPHWPSWGLRVLPSCFSTQSRIYLHIHSGHCLEMWI